MCEFTSSHEELIQSQQNTYSRIKLGTLSNEQVCRHNKTSLSVRGDS